MILPRTFLVLCIAPPAVHGWRESMSNTARYAAAFFAVVIATIIRIWLDPLFGERSPYITYIIAIIVIAWFSGLGPAIVTMIFGFLSAFYFFASPRGSILVSGTDAQVGTLWYVATGVFSITFTELTRAAERRANSVALQLQEKQALLEREVRERRVAQQECTSLLRRIVSVQEEERKRISRDLHDQCGQDLTAMKLELKILSESISPAEEVRQRFDALRGLIDRVSDEVHHLSLKLRPSVLDDLGLKTAVDNYLGSWKALTGVPVDFECRGWDERRVPDEVETALYRVLQEALTNVARHAKADAVNVLLTRDSDHIDLIIEDRGRGFTTPAVAPQPRLGLLGMRERMEAVGGRLEVESAEGLGTTVFARVSTKA
jgi:signal transduction histidine kinase